MRLEWVLATASTGGEIDHDPICWYPVSPVSATARMRISLAPSQEPEKRTGTVTVRPAVAVTDEEARSMEHWLFDRTPVSPGRPGGRQCAGVEHQIEDAEPRIISELAGPGIGRTGRRFEPHPHRVEVGAALVVGEAELELLRQARA